MKKVYAFGQPVPAWFLAGLLADGLPYNYLTISKGMREVEIEGSSVRRGNGTLNVLSFYYANYQHPTLDDVIKLIAEW